MNTKYGSRVPRNRSTIFNVKVIHYPCNCEPSSKIGRLSLISIELNLFQELESVVHSVRRLNHDDWFVAVDLLIFHILMIPNKDALGSRTPIIVITGMRLLWFLICLKDTGA